MTASDLLGIDLHHGQPGGEPGCRCAPRGRARRRVPACLPPARRGPLESAWGRAYAAKLGELVDEPLERFDLSHDRFRALLYQTPGSREARPGSAAPTARRTNWIGVSGFLDLVREPPRHFAPTRPPFCARNERRDVVEHQHRPLGDPVLGVQPRGRGRRDGVSRPS